MTAQIINLRAWRAAHLPLSAEQRQRYARILLNRANKTSGLFMLAQSHDEEVKVEDERV